MKKLIIGCSVVMSLNLVGCNTLDSASQFSNNTVGKGVKYVSTTGAYVGRTVGNGVGTVLGTGVGMVSGKTVNTKQQVNTYNKKGLIYRDGHAYQVQNGKYVLVR